MLEANPNLERNDNSPKHRKEPTPYFKVYKASLKLLDRFFYKEIKH